jgi:hypothetical protein
VSFFEIPPVFTDQTAFVQEVDLDGTTFRLNFRWSTRESVWYLDLLDLSDDPIAMGMKLVEGALLLRYIVDARRPPGELYFIGVATQTNLGTDAVLVYADEDEV